MHPHTFYSTLFGHEKRDEVFVIMSFAEEFRDRWVKVIEPMIREGLSLKPNRVDYNVSGESIVHDILDGIAHSRLVLADITSSAMRDTCGISWPQRNGNVMWELGIAHTTRMPDEVLVIRSDNDPSIFDLTQFRAFSYEPECVEESKEFLRTLAADRLRSVDQMKSDYVQRCAEALDPSSIDFLINSTPATGQPFPIALNMRNALRYPRLFELGLIRTFSIGLEADTQTGLQRTVSQAAITALGKDVMRLLLSRLGLLPMVLQQLLTQLSLSPIAERNAGPICPP
jgi:hypothetical protein